MKLMLSIAAAIVMTAVFAFKNPMAKSVYDFKVKNIDGKEVSLDQYRGKVLLIVNVASECGNTPQYAELEKLYKDAASQGLVVLGFPCNQFGGQEPGTEADIKKFCTKEYSVTFPMFSKIEVKGENQAPLYNYLTHKAENGVLESPVKWNFQKFLVGKDGQVITFIPHNESVYSKSASELIKAALAK